MTFWPLTNSDYPTNQTFHQFHDLDTDFDLHRNTSGFHGAFATGVACQQGTLTLPDTWFRPPFWDLLMLQLLRPNSSNLQCLYSTFHLEYPLVLSRFCLLNTIETQLDSYFVVPISKLWMCQFRPVKMPLGTTRGQSSKFSCPLPTWDTLYAPLRLFSTNLIALEWSKLMYAKVLLLSVPFRITNFDVFCFVFIFLCYYLQLLHIMCTTNLIG